MARNKYPEETVEKILDVSLALFFEKGFDNTSIQDIIDNLGGLSKGAVYHHFKSKEDILSAALDRDNARLYNDLRAIRDNAGLTGAQKFQALLKASIDGPQLDVWAKIAPTTDPVKNSRLLGLEYKSLFEETVPYFVEPIIRQGVADGSIKTKHPRLLAEILVLLANLWAGPMFRPSSPEQLQERIEYYIDIAAALGIELVDDGMLDTLNGYVETFGSHTEDFNTEGKDTDMTPSP